MLRPISSSGANVEAVAYSRGAAGCGPPAVDSRMERPFWNLDDAEWDA